MHIQLEVGEDAIRLTTPPCDLDSPLGRAITSQMWLDSIDHVFEQFGTDEQCVFSLALTGWRHWLKRVEHSYDYYAKAEKSTSHPSLVWQVGGKDYDAVKAIPAFADRPHDVGTFQLSHDKLVAIDSCYDKFRDGVQMLACPGNWTAKALIRDEWNGFGVALLAVSHETCKEPLFARETYELEPAGNAGVDSGTCGFFDQAKYPLDEKEHEHEDGTFYKACCDLTDCRGEYGLNDSRTFPLDVLPDGSGVNSRTLIGDGGYDCFVRKNKEGQVVAAVLVFDYHDKVFSNSEEED